MISVSTGVGALDAGALDANSGVPWPVLALVVLMFGFIQYVGPKIAERFRSEGLEAQSEGEAAKAKYEGAARFVEATGDYGIRILEQLTKVQKELEAEKKARNRLERRLARAYGVLGVLEEEINHFREAEGLPPISERIRRMFPELYEDLLDGAEALADLDDVDVVGRAHE